MYEPGEAAPDFTLEDSLGKVRRLSDYAGKRIVLFFYPEDMTPGCTREVCGFRDHFNAYTQEGVELLGVSLDSPENHEEFAREYNLPFTLLSDVNAEVSRAYGVYGEKEVDGRTVHGILRTTFVIGPDGQIEKVFREVKVDSHALDVLQSFHSPPGPGGAGL